MSVKAVKLLRSVGVRLVTALALLLFTTVVLVFVGFGLKTSCSSSSTESCGPFDAIVGIGVVLSVAASLPYVVHWPRWWCEEKMTASIVTIAGISILLMMVS